jgi:hypothetical protein
MRRYTRPIAVADDLSLLRGQTTRVVTLPRHLDWSACGRVVTSIRPPTAGVPRLLVSRSDEPDREPQQFDVDAVLTSGRYGIQSGLRQRFAA